MEEFVPLTGGAAPDWESAVEECLSEMRLLNDQLRRGRAEIDQLKADREQLRRETQALKAESRLLMADLQVAA